MKEKVVDDILKKRRQFTHFTIKYKKEKKFFNGFITDLNEKMILLKQK